MTPFQEFRYWLRRAPAPQRWSAGVAAVLAVALLGWLLVPVGDDGAELATTAGGFETGGPGVDGSSPGSTLPGDGSSPVVIDPATGQPVPGGGGPGGPGATVPGGGPPQATVPAGGGPGGCVSPPGSAPGITDTEIRIAVLLVNIVGPAANDIFGIPRPAEQQRMYEAVISAMNAEGGIACRRIVPQFVSVNAADANDRQRKCLDMVEAGVFAVIDGGNYATFPEKQCFGQNRLPYFGGYFLTQAEIDTNFPYLFNLANLDTLHRNTALGLASRGFFDPANGFRRLGFLYTDCSPALVDNMNRALRDAGVPSDAIEPFNVGCPSTFSSPADLAQAVLRFQQRGVTHVTFARFAGDFANFTRIAQQQGFRPLYGIPDEAIISISYGNQPPDYNNIANAIAITSLRAGEERTPGAVPTPGTVRCDAIYAAAGLPPTYQQASFAGNACSQFWMFQAAVQNASELRRDALAAGLQRAGSVEFSFPQGPNDFRGQGVTTGGQFWRATRFNPQCTCWQTLETDFHGSFPR